MPIEVKTVYTKETLLCFSDFLALRKRALWVLMFICSAVVLYLCVYAALLVGWDSEFTWYIVFILLWDALFVFLNFGLPRITVKKAKNLNAEVCYLFTEEQIEINAVTAHLTDRTLAQYSLVTKVLKSKQYLYLMLEWNQGFVVNLQELSEEQIVQLRKLLESKLPAKKIKWKA